MTNHDRRYLICQLLGEEYPQFCVGVRRFSPESEIFLLPEGIENASPEATKAKTFFDYLETLSAEELRQIVEKRYAERAERREAQHRFNHPSVFATESVYDYWVKAAYWSLNESVALLLGRNPEIINEKAVAGDRGNSQLGVRYRKLWDLAKRAYDTRQLSAHPRPQKVVEWAKDCLIEVPEALQSALDRHGLKSQDWKVAFQNQTALVAALQQELLAKNSEIDAFSVNRLPEKSLGARERESLLKLVLAMAIDGYGYDPSAAKSPTAGELAGHVELLGMSLSDDTIRNYLKEAKELLPGTQTE